MTHRPSRSILLHDPTAPQPPFSPLPTPKSPKERLKLIRTINKLPKVQFEELIFALEPPAGKLSASSNAQANRAKELLDWAAGPTGQGIGLVQEMLAEINDPSQ